MPPSEELRSNILLNNEKLIKAVREDRFEAQLHDLTCQDAKLGRCKLIVSQISLHRAFS